MVLSYTVTMFALGYNFDFAQAKFLKTGSLYIKTQIIADVFIDGENEGRTSRFNNSFSLNKLTPQYYDIGVSADGYLPWSKTASISESLLTGFPSIYLVKANIEPVEEDLALASASFNEEDILINPADADALADMLKITASSIKKAEKGSGIWYVLASVDKHRPLYTIQGDTVKKISSDVQDFILNDNGTRVAWFTKSEVYVDWLEDTSNQPLRSKGDREMIMGTVLPFLKVEWFSTGEHLILADKNKIQFTELDGRGGRNAYTLFQTGSNIKDIVYKPGTGRILISVQDKIFSLSF